MDAIGLSSSAKDVISTVLFIVFLAVIVGVIVLHDRILKKIREEGYSFFSPLAQFRTYQMPEFCLAVVLAVLGVLAGVTLTMLKYL